MVPLISVAIIIALCVFFVKFRAYVCFNLFLFAAAWTLVCAIIPSTGQMTTDQIPIMIFVEVFLVAALILALFLSSKNVPRGEKLAYCLNLLLCGLLIFLKVLFICSIILIPLWRMFFQEGFQERITELGERIYVRHKGNGIYEDPYGREYKEKK